MSRSADPDELAQGRIIASKYRLEQPIGRGGMGIVYRATHLELSFNVAIKVLTSDVDSADSRDRFLREARAAAQIRSEHAARVFDLGSLPSGAPFIVMECLEGMNLRQLLRQRGSVPPDQAVSFIVQACRAVAEAHALGIIHRDIKPSNLFLCERDNAPPVVKVLDFGISKTLGAMAPSSTITGSALVGSPQYMSPERLRSSAKIDATVDVWAFGAVLYELISGTPAFAGQTVPALLASIVADEPEALLGKCPALSPHVAAIVDKCLQKDPSKRYRNALELLQALAAQPVIGTQTAAARTALEPTAGENTKVQPGFSDTTLMLSPSDIELLSEPQPPTTTTIEPITKEATAKRVARTIPPLMVTRPSSVRRLVYAGLAASSIVLGLAVLRLRANTHSAPEIALETTVQKPASGTSVPTPSTVQVMPTTSITASLRPDELPLTAEDLAPVLSSPATPETKDKTSIKPRRKNKSPDQGTAQEPRSPSSAKKPKKSGGTELFSDIH